MIQFKHTNVIIFAFIINLTCFNINFHFLNCRRNEAQDFYYEGEYYKLITIMMIIIIIIIIKQ